MKAMILSAGLGTRLAKYTKHTPKPLVPLAGKPMLYYVIEHLKKNGVKEIVLNLHHLGEQIRVYLEKLADPELKFIFSEEDELLDTGGGVAKAHIHFKDEECFIMYNADIYCELSLRDLIMQHTKDKVLATLAVSSRNSGRVLLFDQDDFLIGWRNKNTGQEKIVAPYKTIKEYGFCGIQVLSPNFIKYCPSNELKFSIVTVYLNAISQGERIKAFSIGNSAWFDLGSEEKLEEANKWLGRSS